MPENPLEKLNKNENPEVNQESSVEKQDNDKEKEQEKGKEQEAEKVAEKKPEKPNIETPDPNKLAGLAAQSSPASIYKKREKEIDNVLSEGLNDIYLKMSPTNRKEFRVKGEETTKKINDLLGETKVKVKKIINLIKNWLKVIPGVNKFFIEQETKLKTDKIMNIKKNL
ncbi:MAG: hypothetical protein PF488_03405 [Patescibacteria group bacterium]|jgi:hypothetical protein|nr:hypothetical protein [Patescibacteria group bacterium]